MSNFLLLDQTCLVYLIIQIIDTIFQNVDFSQVSICCKISSSKRLKISAIVKEFSHGNSKLVVNPKSRDINQTLNTNFYLITFPAKIHDIVFPNKEKTLFWGSFCLEDIFPKTSGHVQLQQSPTFKCPRYRVDWPSNQKLFHYYQHAKKILKGQHFFIKYPIGLPIM